MCRIVDEFSEQAPVRLVMGGLAPGTTDPVDDETRATIRDHWDHVRETTGQPFDYSFFDRPHFVYDTQPASQAVVVARRLRPEMAISFLGFVQRAFYADNQDVTSHEVLYDLAENFGFPREDFIHDYESIDAFGATRGDFILSREVGVTGFPALLAGEHGKFVALTAGYQSWDNVRKIIGTWIGGEDQPREAAHAH